MLVGWTGRKGLRHLQLGDEEEEETQAKKEEETKETPMKYSAGVRAEKTRGFLSPSVPQSHRFKEELL